MRQNALIAPHNWPETEQQEVLIVLHSALCTCNAEQTNRNAAVTLYSTTINTTTVVLPNVVSRRVVTSRNPTTVL